MNRWTRPLMAACLLQASFALGAHAADSLQQLLDETRNARAIEAKANAAREQEFLASRDRQAEMLADAKAKRDAAQKRSEQLSAAFDANELKLNDLETLLKNREGNLGELFGVTRQLTGDLSSVVYGSLTSAQFPGRDQFFSKLAKGKALPSIKELEQLWFEMLREMTETGTVARFKTNIVTADGKQEPAEVVRVGPFIAMADGKYLTYEPKDGGVLQVLARQPGPEMLELADNLKVATSGYTKSYVDPSRGVLLGITVQRPDIWERIEHGEAVGYVILLVGVLGSIVAVYQFFYLVFVRIAVRRQLQDLDNPKKDNPLGRVLASFRGDPARVEEDAEVIELRISEAVLKEVPALERFQAFLRLAVAAGPLLGLIGTVIGMIITFQSITESGSSDPKLMANGISQAMIATVLGLGIAIPLLFANAGLVSLSGGIVQVLDEQSTGLLAEHIERRTAEDQRAEQHRRV